MWYATFNRSILSLLFMSLALLSFLTLDVLSDVWRGPFIFLIPLPIAIVYFWKYTDSKFKKKMDLSFRLAKQRDHRNKQLQEAGRPIPLTTFKKHFYRQPVLTDGALFPEPYRKIDPSEDFDGVSGVEEGQATSAAAAGATAGGAVFSPLHPQSQPVAQQDPDDPATGKSESVPHHQLPQSQFETRMRASSMDMHRVEDEVEDPPTVLERYFREYVLPLTDPDYQTPPPPTANANTSTRRKGSIF